MSIADAEYRHHARPATPAGQTRAALERVLHFLECRELNMRDRLAEANRQVLELIAVRDAVLGALGMVREELSRLDAPEPTATNTPPPGRPYSKAEYDKAVAQFTGVDHDGPIARGHEYIAGCSCSGCRLLRAERDKRKYDSP